MGFLKKWIRKIWCWHKLRCMDRRWRMQGGASYQLFPPSFYYIHSAEEIKDITEKKLTDLRKQIKEYGGI